MRSIVGKNSNVIIIKSVALTWTEADISFSLEVANVGKSGNTTTESAQPMLTEANT